MVATKAFVLVHVPAPSISESVEVVPGQIVVIPVIVGITTVALPWVPQQPSAESDLK